MNNIELRLMAEKNWREENLLKCINTPGRKVSHRTIGEAINGITKYQRLSINIQRK